MHHAPWESRPTTPVNVVLDTDIAGDCDDAGAVAVLHALEALGEARIVGMVCNVKSQWGAPCLDAINTWYGRPDIAVGTLKGDGHHECSSGWCGSIYNRAIARGYPNRIRFGSRAEDAVKVYRRALAEAVDHSVAIAAVGALTVLRDLLDAPADEIAQQSGFDLVRRKVRGLYVMGGRYPDGRKEANFSLDAPASRRVVNDFPAPILFCGSEVGENIHTGPRLFGEVPSDHPVRHAYRRWDEHFIPQWQEDPKLDDRIWSHNSYDQATVLLAVRGLGEDWSAVRGENEILPDGCNRWRDGDRHAYAVARRSYAELAKVIEDLMVLPARR